MLGSKSPLSYSNEYYLTTHSEGVKYEYTIYNTEELPECTLLNHCEDDGVGTTITVHIKNYDDYLKFLRACKQQLRYFNNVIVFDKVNYTSDYDNNYKIYKLGDKLIFTTLGQEKGIVVKNVRYTFREGFRNVLEDHLILNGLNLKILNFYDNFEYCFYFDIGELNITLNREDLEYTEKTNKALVEKVVEVYNWLQEKATEQEKSKSILQIWDEIEDRKFTLPINEEVSLKLSRHGFDLKTNIVGLPNLTKETCRSLLSLYNCNRDWLFTDFNYDYTYNTLRAFYPGFYGIQSFPRCRKYSFYKRLKRILEYESIRDVVLAHREIYNQIKESGKLLTDLSPSIINQIEINKKLKREAARAEREAKLEAINKKRNTTRQKNKEQLEKIGYIDKEFSLPGCVDNYYAVKIKTSKIVKSNIFIVENCEDSGFLTKVCKAFNKLDRKLYCINGEVSTKLKEEFKKWDKADNIVDIKDIDKIKGLTKILCKEALLSHTIKLYKNPFYNFRNIPKSLSYYFYTYKKYVKASDNFMIVSLRNRESNYYTTTFTEKYFELGKKVYKQEYKELVRVVSVLKKYEKALDDINDYYPSIMPKIVKEAVLKHYKLPNKRTFKL